MLNTNEIKIINNIEEYGFHIISVFDPEQNELTITYSVGFATTLKSPEFIIIGLDIKLMQSMLWSLFEQIKDGKAVYDGQVWSDLVDGFDCVSKLINPTQHRIEYLNSALWYWNTHQGRTDPFQAYQIFWPGAVNGLFPWDDGCDELVKSLQPNLYLPFGN